MRDEKGMSRLNSTLTGVPLALTFDLEFTFCDILRVDGPIDVPGHETIMIGVDKMPNHYLTLRRRVPIYSVTPMRRLLLGTGVT